MESEGEEVLLDIYITSEWSTHAVHSPRPCEDESSDIQISNKNHWWVCLKTSTTRYPGNECNNPKRLVCTALDN